MRVSIIIPAYNEEKRIEKTLKEYTTFFNILSKKKILDYEIIVVINNTLDKTEQIVKKLKKEHSQVRYLNFKQGGKGFAIIQGFRDSLKRKNTLIGFVDADNATRPSSFYGLIKSLKNSDGAIANRYDFRSKILPQFTFRRLVVGRIFNFIVRALFLLPYRDTQCGAKVFRREAIEKALPDLTITQWAFDIDLLYLMRRRGLSIISCPTVWEDKEGSKIRLVRTSISMFLAIIQLRLAHSYFSFILKRLKKPIGKTYHFFLNFLDK